MMNSYSGNYKVQKKFFIKLKYLYILHFLLLNCEKSLSQILWYFQKKCIHIFESNISLLFFLFSSSKFNINSQYNSTRFLQVQYFQWIHSFGNKSVCVFLLLGIKYWIWSNVLIKALTIYFKCKKKQETMQNGFILGYFQFVPSFIRYPQKIMLDGRKHSILSDYFQECLSNLAQ